MNLSRLSPTELASLLSPREAMQNRQKILNKFPMPAAYRSFIENCLSYEPNKRPSFELLALFFENQWSAISNFVDNLIQVVPSADSDLILEMSFEDSQEEQNISLVDNY